MVQMRSDNGVVRRKNKFLPRIFIALVALIILGGLFFLLHKVYVVNVVESPNIKKLFSLWEEKNYQEVYEQSCQLLNEDQLNSRALTFKGYSAFFLALAQTELEKTQNYLEDCINSLRIALIDSSKKNLAQIYYMLGKAYFHKNVVSDYHYYADLTVKYLELARKKGFSSNDIPEYLGLSYAQLGQTENSISAFTEALLVRESDELLLAIAQQYYNCNKANTAKQYLNKINQESSNELLVLKSRILMAQIYIDEKKYDEALKEYESILQKDANSADAYYGIGVIYELQGDLIKARSEWRKALKVKVNHQGALKKLG